jgi:glycosyltransferase involved in cell wall biosynthesis
MFVSVIIPTYNRKEVLRNTLLSLCEQTYPATEYEIVVTDDGSTDGTGEMVRSLHMPCSLRYFRQQNRGPAAARNLGAQNARGELLIFLDDDMTADSYLIEEHVVCHSQHPGSLVVGAMQTTIPVEIKLPPFTRIYSLSLRGLDRIAVPDGSLPPEHCMIGNLSVKKGDFHRIGMLDDRLFSEKRWTGWEDVDLGYRAVKHGLQIRYHPRALSLHNDYSVADLGTFCKRAKVASQMAVALFEKHPDLEGSIEMFKDKGYISLRQDSFGVVLRKVIRAFMASSPVLRTLEAVTGIVESCCPSSLLLRPLYRWMIGTYIFIGFREGLGKHRSR